MPILRLSILLLILLTAVTARAAEQPLNVLIIQTDEHNFRTLGCYRKLMSEQQAYIWGPGVEVKTPNIDWLADNGAICTFYCATSPVCTPSRAALVSGRYPHNTGSPQNNSPLLNDVVTFAEVLKRKGYATGYAGKWHLDGPAKPGWAPKRTFTSDHGDMCGELGRHNKGIPCEGSARIPFVIRAPEVIPSGQVIDHALGTVDFKPTLLGLLDVDIDAPAEGSDASAIFKKEAPSDPEAITYVRIPAAGKAWLGAFTSRYKLVASTTDPLAFFDLETDPNELENVLADPTHRKEIRRLARGLKQYTKKFNDPIAESAAIQADLAWAIGDSDNYTPTPRSGGKKAKKQ